MIQQRMFCPFLVELNGGFSTSAARKKVLLWDDKWSLFPCPAKFSGQGEIKLIEAEEKNLFVEKAKIAS